MKQWTLAVRPSIHFGNALPSAAALPLHRLIPVRLGPGIKGIKLQVRRFVSAAV
jgi:hypothetical protein